MWCSCISSSSTAVVAVVVQQIDNSNNNKQQQQLLQLILLQILLLLSTPAVFTARVHGQCSVYLALVSLPTVSQHVGYTVPDSQLRGTSISFRLLTAYEDTHAPKHSKAILRKVNLHFIIQRSPCIPDGKLCDRSYKGVKLRYLTQRRCSLSCQIDFRVWSRFHAARFCQSPLFTFLFSKFTGAAVLNTLRFKFDESCPCWNLIMRRSERVNSNLCTAASTLTSLSH